MFLTYFKIWYFYRYRFIPISNSQYTTKIDIWALGCTFVYMVNKSNFFNGDSTVDTIHKIFQILGTPNDQTWPGVSKLPEWSNTFPQWKTQNLSNFIKGGKYVDIISACLTLIPEKRADTQQLLDLLHNNYHI